MIIMNIKSAATELDIEKTNSYQRHQRQRFWQILTPLGLSVLLILALAVMVVMTATKTEVGGVVSQWADASLIWLSLPALTFAIITILILVGLIVLVARILKIVPFYTFLGQQYSNLIALKVKYWSNKLVAPLIAVQSFRAAVRGFFSALLGRSEK